MTVTAVLNSARRISHDGLLTLTVERADVVRQEELLIFHNRFPFRVLLRRREYGAFIDVRPVDGIAENGDGERPHETACVDSNRRGQHIRFYDFSVVDCQAVWQAEIF